MLSLLPLSANNGLNGPLPTELTSLPALEEIDFMGNQLTGTVPSIYGSFPSLAVLRLGSNHLPGTIPLDLFVGNLSYLSLSNNSLTGTVPTEVGLFNGTWLGFGSNSLSGSIPTALFQAGKGIQFLFFNDNKLTGTLPTEIGALNQQNLLRIFLNGNPLHGTIPSEIGLLKDALRELDISWTNMDGSLPEELFTKCTNSVFLGFSNCDLTGTISSGLQLLTRLETFDISNSKFHGTIPTELSSLTELRQFIVNGNDLSGSIPLSVCTLADPIKGTFEVAADCLPRDGPGEPMKRIGWQHRQWKRRDWRLLPYRVERSLSADDTSGRGGCAVDDHVFRCYNGGLDEKYKDTGYPIELLFTVKARVVRHCADLTERSDSCTITVEGGSFHPALKPTATMYIPGMFEENKNNPNQSFLRLAYDESRCEHHPSLANSESRRLSDYHTAETLAPDDGNNDEPVEATIGPIHQTFRFSWFQGRGRQPMDDEIGLLLQKTRLFLESQWRADTIFGDKLVRSYGTDVTDSYSSDTPDLFVLSLTSELVVYEPVARYMASRAASAISNKVLNEFISEYTVCEDGRRRLGHRESSMLCLP
ncbi:Leucine rich repeat N-terminal domain [Seminavis robusta]|uniref:Leucine rich repeat N-terminal domain n=1 Tax=Seminavis robusta TaxID=568900 RepID=A0A9N8EEY7_9STRA|nr:Leucine rich repeat N-terminal domain [Seminavis robusta]|eukprot:Sro1025_g232740.1 Leucine rich repeat N-terminal domain (590) ;mRNA; f:10038-12215